MGWQKNTKNYKAHYGLETDIDDKPGLVQTPYHRAEVADSYAQNPFEYHGTDQIIAEFCIYLYNLKHYPKMLLPEHMTLNIAYIIQGADNNSKYFAHKMMIEALLASGCDPERISSLVDLRREIIEIYRHLFFDMESINIKRDKGIEFMSTAVSLKFGDYRADKRAEFQRLGFTLQYCAMHGDADYAIATCNKASITFMPELAGRISEATSTQQLFQLYNASVGVEKLDRSDYAAMQQRGSVEMRNLYYRKFDAGAKDEYDPLAIAEDGTAALQEAEARRMEAEHGDNYAMKLEMKAAGRSAIDTALDQAHMRVDMLSDEDIERDLPNFRQAPPEAEGDTE